MVRLTATDNRNGPLPIGTRVVSTRDDVLGVPEFSGYTGRAATVIDWVAGSDAPESIPKEYVVLVFDEDPCRHAQPEEGFPGWVWPLADLEVIDEDDGLGFEMMDENN